ncbi:MAG: hypothetical protein ABI217_03140 [Chthoniobacterales bacterium]
MDLIGKSYKEIETAVKGVKRARLVDLLKLHVTLEPFFSPEQIAKARQISIAAVMHRIKVTRQLRAYLIGNRWRVPLSAVRDWDSQTRVTD